LLRRAAEPVALWLKLSRLKTQVSPQQLASKKGGSLTKLKRFLKCIQKATKELKEPDNWDSRRKRLKRDPTQQKMLRSKHFPIALTVFSPWLAWPDKSDSFKRREFWDIKSDRMDWSCALLVRSGFINLI